jgi:hypothetical protein
MPVGRLVRQVADKHQVCTQRSWKRPFGVGLLVGGYDRTGPHLYNTCPSGNYYEYKAMAIGARSQVGPILHCYVIRLVWLNVGNTVLLHLYNTCTTPAPAATTTSTRPWPSAHARRWGLCYIVLQHCHVIWLVWLIWPNIESTVPLARVDNC